MAPSRSSRRRLLAAGVVASTAVAGLAIATPAIASTGDSSALDRLHDHAAVSKPALLTNDEAAAKLAASLPKKGSYGFLLQLKPMSTAAKFGQVRAAKTASAAKDAAKSQLVTVEAAQDKVVDQLDDLAGKTEVLYRTHAALAGIAVRTGVKNLTALYELPGVTAVYPITPKEPDNSYAVPFQGAPAAWEGDANGKYLGQGVVVADIDTGFDYTHADFGGKGTPAAYDDAYAASTEAPADGSYDPDKFLASQSYDLVGDDYNADPTDPSTYQPVPHPDPNPLDCSPAHGGEGHGSHTAGTIAGYGVTSDGHTYEGPYTSAAVNTDNADQWKIGPGMAPKATIMALRVFGCVGSTDVVSEAIDMAVDPNGDGDTSDGANIINMSLGSDFGAPDDADAVVADAAADHGVTLAISMGNSYDVYDIGGSPGASTKAITVAASLDAQSVVDGTSVTLGDAEPTNVASERSISYPWGDSTAVGGGDLSGVVALPDPSNTSFAGCSAYTPEQAAAVAGKIALLHWNDTNLECGSVARGFYARQAGAIGFVFGSTEESFSAGITGDTGGTDATGANPDPSKAIPGVLVANSAYTAMLNAIAADETVTINGTSTSSVVQNFPGDNDKMTDFSSRGLRGNGNLKPDVAAVGGTVFSVLPGAGDEGQNMSGTSMAAPMVAGLAALVKSKHGGWSPEQIKADIMNTADKNLYVGGAGDTDAADRYAPMRVGAGRIDAASAISNDVLATTADSDGAVSASFGTVELPGAEPVTQTRTIKVQNTGTTSKTYAVTVDQITTVPGVSYTVSPSTVTVTGKSTATVTLTLTADPSTWSKTFDPTKGDTDPATDLPQQTIAESSGNVVFTPASGSSLRLPYYAAPKPVSKMSQAGSVTLADDGTGSLELTGTGVDKEDVFSIAQGFELTATSPTALPCTDEELASEDGPVGCLTNESDKGSDIKYVGIGIDPGTADGENASNDNGTSTLDFAVVTHGAHTTPADKDTFQIFEDVDNDGAPDYVTINTHLDESDVLVSETFDLATGKNVDIEVLNSFLGEVDTAAYDSDVLVVPVATGIFSDASTIHYGIEAYGVQGTLVDTVGLNETNDGNYPTPTLVADLAAPGLTVTQGGYAQAVDLPSDAAGGDTSLTVTKDAASYAEEGGQGLLMVHFHNTVGNKAQVVDLRTASTPPPPPPAQTAPSVSLTADPSTVVLGESTTLTATVTDSTGAPMTSGSVTFEDGSGATLGTGTLGADGKAAASYKPTAAGTVQVTAVYGAGTDTEASSAPVTVTVKPSAPKKTTPSVSVKAPGKVKAGTRFTVTVTVSSAKGVKPTGRVKLLEGGMAVGPKALRGGKTTFRVRAPKQGKLRLRALYLGDAQHASAKSKVKTVKVNATRHRAHH